MSSDGDELKEPAYITALKQFGSGDPTAAEVGALEVEMYSGPDRAAALVLAALVENALEKLLRKNLREEGVNQLFKFGGPLGDFASKISMCFSLKLVGQLTRRDLTNIRHLRNQFAHSRRPIEFEMKEVADVCAQLSYPKQPGIFLNFNMLNKVADERLNQASDRNHPRTQYFTACNEIAQRVYFIRGGAPEADLNKLL